eukprot:TRINITY_DN4759_c0_g1_i2.p1 TRINITY_DN4759_c0_g1~~TRINITY_DN4759_c0_g1_i2.p1  ORF type:complete len:1534 (+),score=517.56 TRINITY_DN4759_c0_g1_i2:610-5211(+)
MDMEEQLQKQEDLKRLQDENAMLADAIGDSYSEHDGRGLSRQSSHASIYSSRTHDDDSDNSDNESVSSRGSRSSRRRRSESEKAKGRRKARKALRRQRSRSSMTDGSESDSDTFSAVSSGDDAYTAMMMEKLKRAFEKEKEELHQKHERELQLKELELELMKREVDHDLRVKEEESKEQMEVLRREVENKMKLERKLRLKNALNEEGQEEDGAGARMGRRGSLIRRTSSSARGQLPGMPGGALSPVLGMTRQRSASFNVGGNREAVQKANEEKLASLYNSDAEEQSSKQKNDVLAGSNAATRESASAGATPSMIRSRSRSVNDFSELDSEGQASESDEVVQGTLVDKTQIETPKNTTRNHMLERRSNSGIIHGMHSDEKKRITGQGNESGGAPSSAGKLKPIQGVDDEYESERVTVNMIQESWKQRMEDMKSQHQKTIDKLKHEFTRETAELRNLLKKNIESENKQDMASLTAVADKLSKDLRETGTLIMQETQSMKNGTDGDENTLNRKQRLIALEDRLQQAMNEMLNIKRTFSKAREFRETLESKIDAQELEINALSKTIVEKDDQIFILKEEVSKMRGQVKAVNSQLEIDRKEIRVLTKNLKHATQLSQTLKDQKQELEQQLVVQQARITKMKFDTESKLETMYQEHIIKPPTVSDGVNTDVSIPPLADQSEYGFDYRYDDDQDRDNRSQRGRSTSRSRSRARSQSRTRSQSRSRAASQTRDQKSENRRGGRRSRQLETVTENDLSDEEPDFLNPRGSQRGGSRSRSRSRSRSKSSTRTRSRNGERPQSAMSQRSQRSGRSSVTGRDEINGSVSVVVPSVISEFDESDGRSPSRSSTRSARSQRSRQAHHEEVDDHDHQEYSDVEDRIDDESVSSIRSHKSKRSHVSQESHHSQKSNKSHGGQKGSRRHKGTSKTQRGHKESKRGRGNVKQGVKTVSPSHWEMDDEVRANPSKGMRGSKRVGGARPMSAGGNAIGLGHGLDNATDQRSARNRPVSASSKSSKSSRSSRGSKGSKGSRGSRASKSSRNAVHGYDDHEYADYESAGSESDEEILYGLEDEDRPRNQLEKSIEQIRKVEGAMQNAQELETRRTGGKRAQKHRRSSEQSQGSVEQDVPQWDLFEEVAVRPQRHYGREVAVTTDQNLSRVASAAGEMDGYEDGGQHAMDERYGVADVDYREFSDEEEDWEDRQQDESQLEDKMRELVSEKEKGRRQRRGQKVRKQGRLRDPAYKPDGFAGGAMSTSAEAHPHPTYPQPEGYPQMHPYRMMKSHKNNEKIKRDMVQRERTMVYGEQSDDVDVTLTPKGAEWKKNRKAKKGYVPQAIGQKEMYGGTSAQGQPGGQRGTRKGSRDDGDKGTFTREGIEWQLKNRSQDGMEEEYVQGDGVEDVYLDESKPRPPSAPMQGRGGTSWREKLDRQQQSRRQQRPQSAHPSLSNRQMAAVSTYTVPILEEEVMRQDQEEKEMGLEHTRSFHMMAGDRSPRATEAIVMRHQDGEAKEQKVVTRTGFPNTSFLSMRLEGDDEVDDEEEGYFLGGN